jgi:hypothetical protein
MHIGVVMSVDVSALLSIPPYIFVSRNSASILVKFNMSFEATPDVWFVNLYNQ